jgi:hypothetical protein
MLRQRVELILLGGAAFWAPTIAIELVTGRDLNLLVATLLGPTVLASIYVGLALWRRRGIRAYLWMLIGLYSLGSWFMYIAFTPSGGGFASIHRFADLYILFLSTVVPILTLVFSGYDGTLFGVLLITVLLPCVHYFLRRRSQIRHLSR